MCVLGEFIYDYNRNKVSTLLPSSLFNLLKRWQCIDTSHSWPQTDDRRTGDLYKGSFPQTWVGISTDTPPCLSLTWSQSPLVSPIGPLRTDTFGSVSTIWDCRNKDGVQKQCTRSKWTSFLSPSFLVVLPFFIPLLSFSFSLNFVSFSVTRIRGHRGQNLCKPLNL